MSSNYVFALSCTDRPGIVATITAELAALGANIAESNQLWDRQTNRFFMRLTFQTPENVDREQIDRVLKPAINRFDMTTELAEESKTRKIIVMVSRFDHAMLHLLYQIRVGRLAAEVVAIVSNHEDVRRAAEFEGVPFYHWPVTKENKAAQEEGYWHWYAKPNRTWSCSLDICRCSLTRHLKPFSAR